MKGYEGKWLPPPLLWIPLVVCGIFLFLADTYHVGYYPLFLSMKGTQPNLVNSVLNSPSLQGFLVKTSGCRIPDMDAFDPSIMTFVVNETQPVCNNGIPPLMESNSTSVFLVNTSLESYKIEELELLKCCYRSFERTKPSKTESDRNIVYTGDWITISLGGMEIFDEFIKVICTYNETEVYKDFFAFVPPLNKSRVPKRDELNVLIIGLDAVSRLNLHRQMPETVQMLQNLDFVEMLGYNKVADNTFPNLIPVLTGLSERELVRACWPNTLSRFDDCPFIWKNFREQNFTAAFAEDASWMGIFNYQRMGFLEQPTDYYWSYYNMVAEKEIGNSHLLNVNRCVGGRPVYKTLLEYIQKFVMAMNDNDRSYFGFFWEVSISHDFLNSPKLADKDFRKLFAFLNESGHLEKTVVVFMSDHGIRWGAIRSTYQGRLEERLPFLQIHLPVSYRRRHPLVYANLRKNTRRLTTPYDLHETLKDLLDPYSLSASFLEERNENYYNDTHAYSLFGKIPQERTCESAKIAVHWCACQTAVPVNVHDKYVKEAALYTVGYVNDMLEGYAECANLTLDAIFMAHSQQHSDLIAGNSKNFFVDYTIVLRTQPGGGVFEVTVRKRVERQHYKFEITGTISRINLYGKQSQCVTDFHMKLYCYCKRWLK